MRPPCHQQQAIQHRHPDTLASAVLVQLQGGKESCCRSGRWFYCGVGNSDLFGLVDGLNFALQYQGENGGSGKTKNSRSESMQNGDGYGISTSYNSEIGLSVGAAYSNSERTNGQEVNTGNDGAKAEAWTAGIKYDANNVYLATMYAETCNMTWVGGSNTSYACTSSCGGVANKTKNFEVVAQYQFDFGLRPSIAYLHSKASGEGVSEYVVKYIDIGSYYYFNKNMSTYVDYKVNLLKDNEFTRTTGINTDNVVGVGIIYQF